MPENSGSFAATFVRWVAPLVLGTLLTGTSACGGTEISNGGACQAQCAVGDTLCAGGTCANLQTDPNNCGSCGRACGPGQGCTRGSCGCPAGNLLCSGSCVNPQTDPSNCGSCDSLCTGLKSCVNGTCVCAKIICPTGQAQDPTTCACSTACPAGTQLCGSCVNTNIDANNCGSCSAACLPSETCTGGICKCAQGACVTYLGCFRDQGDPTGTSGRDLDGLAINDQGMTTEMCTQTCARQGFPYAGTQFWTWCFCGTSYGKSGPADNCDATCQGNMNETCGGTWANSVYQVR
jgi:hypothetical protein